MNREWLNAPLGEREGGGGAGKTVIKPS